MAGLGSRFPSDRYAPKPLIDILGKPMIIRAIESLGFDGRFLFVIRQAAYTDELKNTITSVVPNCIFKEIDYTTEGPACSALLFEEYINNDTELVIANCDQIMEWNSRMFFLNARQYHGCVVTYYSTTDKNSYIKIDRSGLGIEVREKIVISNIGLNGIHYWHKGSDFVSSARSMIDANERAPNGEFYISQTYNHMISRGQRVGIYHIPNEQHHAVGVPEDLELYLRSHG